jgi:hypothetical protein
VRREIRRPLKSNLRRRQASSYTIWEVLGGFPNITGTEVAHLYDINHLEVLHR